MLQPKKNFEIANFEATTKNLIQEQKNFYKAFEYRDIKYIDEPNPISYRPEVKKRRKLPVKVESLHNYSFHNSENDEDLQFYLKNKNERIYK